MQTYVFDGTADGGYFQLSANSGTELTNLIAYNATASVIERELEGLASIGDGNVSVSLVTGGFQVEYISSLAKTNVDTLGVNRAFTQSDLKSANSAVTITTQPTSGASQSVTFDQTPDEGYFQLTFNSAAEKTALIAYNASQAQIEAALESLASIDSVTVSLTGSDASGGFDITLNSGSGVSGGSTEALVVVLTFSGSLDINESGVRLVPDITVTEGYTDNEYQTLTFVDTPQSGYFRLSANSGAELTNLIAYNASASVVEAELEALASFSDVSVKALSDGYEIEFLSSSVSGVAELGTATTFTDSDLQNGSTAVSLSSPIAVGLTQTVAFDQTPNKGFFQFAFNTEATGLIEYNAGAAQIEAALESLASIDDVTVTLTASDASGGFTITFNSGNGLAGVATPALVLVSTFSGSLDLSDSTQLTAANSVSEGVTDNEVQTISLASADSGYFQLTFNGATETTNLIAHDASAATIQQELEALASFTSGDINVTITATGFAVEFQGTNAGSAVEDLGLVTTFSDSDLLDGVNAVVASVSATDPTGGNDESQDVTFDTTPTAGYFGLILNGVSTSLLSHDASASDVETALESLASVGDVTVTTISGGYRVVFDAVLSASEVNVDTLEVVTSFTGSLNLQSTDASATVTESSAFNSTSNESQTLTFTADSGYYRLSANNGTELTNLIAFDADAATVQKELEALASIGAGNVLVSGSAGNLTVSFTGTLAGQDVDALGVVTTYTEGTLKSASSNVTVSSPPAIGATQTVSFDQTPDEGYFQLTFNNAAEMSALIAFDAEAAQIEAALESLASIDDVTVTLAASNASGGFSVTFVSGSGVTGVSGSTTEALGLVLSFGGSLDLSNGVDSVTPVLVETDGAGTNEYQRVTFDQTVDGGYFRLSTNSGAEVTAALAFDATAQEIENALEALNHLTDVEVKRVSDGFVVEFVDVDGMGAQAIDELGFERTAATSTTLSTILDGGDQQGEHQEVIFTATGGEFILTDGTNSATLDWNATAEEVLKQLTNRLSLNVSVWKIRDGHFIIGYDGTADATNLSIDATNLTGVTGTPTVNVQYAGGVRASVIERLTSDASAGQYRFYFENGGSTYFSAPISHGSSLSNLDAAITSGGIDSVVSGALGYHSSGFAHEFELIGSLAQTDITAEPIFSGTDQYILNESGGGSNSLTLFGDFDLSDVSVTFNDSTAAPLTTTAGLALTGETEAVNGIAPPTLTEAQLLPVIQEAFARWAANDLFIDTGVTLDDIEVGVTDLGGNALGFASAGKIWFDTNAAGYGWFVDTTPYENSEFTEIFGEGGAIEAAHGSEAYGKFDLLTVAMHEIGHLLGLPEDTLSGNAGLMSPTIYTGVRKSVTTVDESQATGAPFTGHSGGDASDQQKLATGLETFGAWAANFGSAIDELFSSVPEIPLTGVDLSEVLGFAEIGQSAAEISAMIQTDLEALVESVFMAATGETITTQDVIDAAQDAIANTDTSIASFEMANSTNPREFTVVMDLADFSTALDLNFSSDLFGSLGFEIESGTDLLLSGGLDLSFDFGLDLTDEFFIDSPTLIGDLALNHDDPLNISLQLGPAGVGIRDGFVDVAMSLAFGSSGRLTLTDMQNDSTGTLIDEPSLGSDASYEIYLPIVLEGALAGLQEEPGLLEGSYGGEEAGQDTSIGGFLNSLVSNLSSTSIDELLRLKDLSISALIDGVIAGLEALTGDENNGLAYREIPLLNKSLVGLLGDDSGNVIEKIKDALITARDALQDMQSFEIDLNFMLDEELGLELGAAIDPLGEYPEGTDYHQLVLQTASRLIDLFPDLNGDSTDGDIARALIDSVTYQNRLDDLSAVQTADFLASIDGTLDADSDELAVAIAVADSARLSELQGYNQLLLDNPDFIAALDIMTQYGLTDEVTDSELTERFVTFPASQLQDARDLLGFADALTLQLDDARSLLDEYGLTQAIPTDAEIEATVDGNDAYLATEARDILQAKSDLDLKSLTFESTDEQIEAAAADDAEASELITARDLLNDEVLIGTQRLDAARNLLDSRGLTQDSPTDEEIDAAIASENDIDGTDVITLVQEARETLVTATDDLINAAFELGNLGILPGTSDLVLAEAASDADTLAAANNAIQALRLLGIDVDEARTRLSDLGLDAESTEDEVAVSLIEDQSTFEDRLADRDLMKSYQDGRLIRISFQNDQLFVGFNIDAGVSADVDLQQLEDFIVEIGLPPEVGIDLGGNMTFNGNLLLDFAVGVDLSDLLGGIGDEELFLDLDDFILSGGVSTSNLDASLDFGPLTGSVAGGTLDLDLGLSIGVNDGEPISLAELKAGGIDIVEFEPTAASLDVNLPVALAVNGQTTASTVIAYQTDDLFGDISNLLSQLPSLDDILSVSIEDLVNAIKQGVDYVEKFALDNQSVIADIPILSDYLDDALDITRQGLAFVEKLQGTATESRLSHNGVNGTLDLTFGGEAITINATDQAGDILNAITALDGYDNTIVEVTGTGTTEDPFVIKMIGDQEGAEVPEVVIVDNKLFDYLGGEATVEQPAPEGLAKDIQAIEAFLEGPDVFDLDETQLQTITLSAVATTGSLVLRFEDDLSGDQFTINAGDDAAAVRAAFVSGISTIATDEVEVTGAGTEEDPWEIRFIGSRLGEDMPALEIVSSTLQDDGLTAVEVTLAAGSPEHLNVLFEEGAVIFDIGMDIDFSSQLDFQFSLDQLSELLGNDNPITALLEGASNLLDLGGGIKADIDLFGRVDLVVGFDASGDVGDAAFIGDSTEVTLFTTITADDLDFEAGISLTEGFDLIGDVVGDNPFLQSIQDLLADIGLDSIAVNVVDGTLRLDSGVDEDGDGKFDPAKFHFSFESDDVEDSNNTAAGDGRYSLRELLDDSINPLNTEFSGEVEADLPMFFPTESMPMGGTTEDRNGDGIADNVLHLEITDLNDIGGSLDMVVPDIKGSIGLYALLQNIDIADFVAGTNDAQEDSNDDGIPDTIYAGILGNLEAVLAGSLFGIDLPFIGDKLKGAAQFIGDFRKDVHDKLDELSGGDANAINIIQGGLFEIFGSPGLNILGENDGIAGITKEDIVVTGDARFVQFDLRIADVIFDEQIDLDFSAAVPGLGLEFGDDAGINFKVDYAFDFAFGLSLDDGFYIDTSDASELELNIDASLSEGFETDVTLGFLNLGVKDNGIKDLAGNDRTSGVFGQFFVDFTDAAGNGNDRLTLSELFSGGISNALDVGFKGKAEANLEARVGIPGVDALPKVSTDFVYMQEFGLGGGAVADPRDGTSSFGTAPIIEFRDVTLELNSFLAGFLKPVFGEIQKITKPLQPIIDILSAPVPIVSTLEGKSTTFLDFAARFGGKSAGFFKALDAVVSILKVVNGIDTSEGNELLINFGTFKIGGNNTDFDLRKGDTLSDAGNAGALGGSAASHNESSLNNKVNEKEGGSGSSGGLLSKLKNSGIKLPFLTSPSQIFSLISGDLSGITFVEWDIPKLDLGFELSQSIPIFPGLNAGFFGGVDVLVDLTIGYDSEGISQFMESGDVLDLIDGFFLRDFVDPNNDPNEVEFDLTVGASASIGIGGLVEAGVKGGLQGSLDLNLNDLPIDPNNVNSPGDGKVRFEEIARNLLSGPHCVFDTTGKIDVFLSAFLWVGLKIPLVGKITVFEKEFNFLRETILDFDLVCEPVQPPVLATQIGDKLYLNMGDRAHLRRNINTEDGDEVFAIREVAKKNTTSGRLRTSLKSKRSDSRKARSMTSPIRRLAI